MKKKIIILFLASGAISYTVSEIAYSAGLDAAANTAGILSGVAIVGVVGSLTIGYRFGRAMSESGASIEYEAGIQKLRYAAELFLDMWRGVPAGQELSEIIPEEEFRSAPQPEQRSAPGTNSRIRPADDEGGNRLIRG